MGVYESYTELRYSNLLEYAKLCKSGSEEERKSGLLAAGILFAELNAEKDKFENNGHCKCKENNKCPKCLEKLSNADCAEKFRKRIRENLTRFLKYRPHNLNDALEYLSECDFKAKSNFENLPSYFNDKLKEIEQRLIPGREQNNYLGIHLETRMLCQDLSSCLSGDSITPSERKKLSRINNKLNGYVLRLAQLASMYGIPPKSNWRLSLVSCADAKDDLQKQVYAKPEDKREGLLYLIDESHESYPSWIIFLEGFDGRKPIFATVFDKPCYMMTDRGRVNIEHPQINCAFFEAQFSRLDNFINGYQTLLADFMRSEEFLSRTGYDKVVLLNVLKDIDDRRLKALGWQSFHYFDKPKEKVKKIYGAHLTSPETCFSINKRQSLLDIMNRPRVT